MLTAVRRERVDDRRDRAFADFESWMSARQGRLLRTAYLLTGDRHTAEDLVQTALAKLYLAWDRVAEARSVDAYARKILVNEHTSMWRRLWRHREVVTDTSVHDVPVAAEEHVAVRHADRGVAAHQLQCFRHPLFRHDRSSGFLLTGRWPAGEARWPTAACRAPRRCSRTSTRTCLSTCAGNVNNWECERAQR